MIKKTFSATPAQVQHDWYQVDARDKVLGRLASAIAHRLRGKHKPEYTPHIDTGDYIIVINARHVQMSGNKALAKRYYRHSGYPGGLKTTAFSDMLEQQPEKVVQKAVQGMLPKGSLGRAMLRKLKVYPDAVHQHTAQQPKALEI